MWHVALLSGFYLLGSAVSLFDRDHLVREIETPVDLRKFVEAPQDELADCRQETSIVLFYSGLCPHCLSFAPVWSALARQLECNKHLRFGAFECASSASERQTSVGEWKEVFPGSENWVLSNPSNEVLTPLDACRALVPHGYPTAVAAMGGKCPIEWPKLSSEHSAANQKVLNSGELRLWPGPLSNSVEELAYQLVDAGLADLCPGTGVDGERSVKVVLKRMHNRERRGGVMASSSVMADSSRWSEKARTVDPDGRLHDGMLGLYQILGAWVLGGSDKAVLSTSERVAAVNFCLVAAATLPDLKTKRSLLGLMQLLSEGAESERAFEYIKKDLFLMGIPKPEVFEDVTKGLRLCETNSCAAWSLIHSLAALNRQRFLQEVVACDKWSLAPVAGMDNLRKWVNKLTIGDLNGLCVGSGSIVEAFHDVVFHFFDCQTCRGHFHDAFTGCAADRCEWVSNEPKSLERLLHSKGGEVTEEVGLVLWLWRFHNIVNLRTATEASLRDLRQQLQDRVKEPELKYLHQDVRIPLAVDCSGCRLSVAELDKRIDPGLLLSYIRSGEDTGRFNFDWASSFNLPKVLEYLTKFYLNPDLIGFDSVVWDPEMRKFSAETKIPNHHRIQLSN